jgi:hydroxymethylglutaryl-CoA synthase
MVSAVGIVGYGACVPRHRIKIEEIAKVWGLDAPSFKKGLRLFEKAVAAPDQDAASLAVEASRAALDRAGIDPARIGAVYVGSESHPYAVKPTGTIVAEAVGATPDCHTADLEFACKAGTEGLFLAQALVASGQIEYALAVGADTSQGAPGDPLEFATAAGAAAFVVGARDLVASIDCTSAFMTDTPDFWRRDHQHYPRHGGRFTGEPAYFRHIVEAARVLMAKAGVKPADVDHCVFHQPNGKFPERVAQMLGFKPEQYETGLLGPWVGNLYSGSSPLGLAAVLDAAEPGQRILLVSYGSGAGSDGFLLTARERIREARARAPLVRQMVDGPKCYLQYGEYVKFRGKIRRNE